MIKFNKYFSIINEENGENPSTWIEAIKKVVSENPEGLSASQIWIKIKESDLIKTKAKDPLNNVIYPLLQRHTDNIQDKRSGKPYFTSYGDPRVFKLITNPQEKSTLIENKIINVYCVRAGVANRDINTFLEGNFVGIGYSTIGFDIGSKSKEEINQFLLNKHENSKTSIPQFLQQIELFKKIKKDDIILVPDNEGTNVGKVISEIYLANNENYPNRINIEWLERVGKNKSLNLPKSVFEVKNFDTKMMNFIESEDEEIIKFVPFSRILTTTKKYTFAEAAQLILKQNSNKPMTSHEIWNEVESQGLVETSGKTPWDSMNAKMILYSENTTAIGKKKNSIFRIIEDRPYKFTLINPNSEVQPVPDEEDILPPSDFIKTTEKSKDYVKNEFMQAICVLGKSGAGKSYTIDEILDKSNHKYEFIIPSASTTGLLSQFSPSAKEGRGGYIPSRLGKMIENAYKNNNTFYTAVFDECHKSNIIEMINDELLQAISTERNKNRFISLDDETSELYPSKVLDERGNISISDNLGFIFISSNARVISGNEDFFNRVDLVELTKEGRESVKTIDDLNKLRVKDTDEKYELVSKIMSESKR